MTKRSPLLIGAVIFTYIFLLAFIAAMIIGACYIAVSLLTLFNEGAAAALPLFLIGAACILGGYLINVTISFFLTKKWNWRITNRFEFTEVPKKSKK